MSPAGADLSANLESVRRRIAAAAERARRPQSAVRLIAVSKTFDADLIREAVGAGQRAFGENRVQEALDKMPALSDLELEWHLIGHLQSNKARKAAAAFTWIESIDSIDLLQRVDQAAMELGTKPSVLIQVDLAHEATKHGADERDVPAIVEAALAAKAVRLQGLMILPPLPTHPEESRPWFARLRDVRDALVARGAPAERLMELSMGMSQDFEVAVEEGATMVRVGTAVFGHRAVTE